MSFWGTIIYHIAKLVLLGVSKLLLRLRSEGRSKVPLRGPLIIAANHVSHLDPPLIGTCIPRLARNMAKRELFSVGWLQLFMRSIGTILVDRGHGKQALLDAVEILRRGGCVLIFPEGTRSPTGRLQRGRSGAIVMALRADCPIQPVVIIGSEKALTKGAKRLRCVPVLVRFGEPYRIDYSGDREAIPREVLESECFRMMQGIETLLPEAMRPSLEQKREWYGDQLQ